jgi:hypothetical protein
MKQSESISSILKANALLKILAISTNNIRQGRIKKAEKAFSDIEKKIKDIKG